MALHGGTLSIRNTPEGGALVDIGFLRTASEN
jgi:hypothetical protein